MTWKKAYLETRVLSAGPLELINILYEYATLSVQDARSSLADGEIAPRARAIAKTIAILGELESSLNHELGGEVALNLARLYRYMRDRLTQANLTQADEPLAEVEALLVTLGSGWQQISRETSPAVGAAELSTPIVNWGALPVESFAGHSSQSWSA
jgi:flagellar protein FliS